MAWTSSIYSFLILALFQVVTGQGENPCERGIDLGIIVDRSQSVGKANFLIVKDSLKTFVDNFEISANKTHTSLIFYSFEPEHLFNLSDTKYYSNQAVKNRIDAVPNKVIYGTRTDLALMKAHDHLFSESSGDRPKRPNVLLVLTDGKTAAVSAPYSEVVPPLEDKGVNIIAVGIGNGIDKKELQEIAGERGSVVQVPDFNSLAGKLTEILAEVCIINGGYTHWSPWSDCSATCSGGVKTRERNCTNPEPMGGGANCSELGPPMEEEECNTQNCDDSVDGGYTRWTTWTECSKTCGGGTQIRFRSCSDPFPQKNGKSCDEQGPPEEAVTCNETPCKEKPVPCKQGLDLAVLIDRSVSIRRKNLERLYRSFLPKLFRRIDIRRKATRVALVTFHRLAEIRFDFSRDVSKSRKDINTYLASMSPQVSHHTRTDRGLKAVRKSLFTKRGGGRASKQNVLLTFTDGRAYPRKVITPFTETVPPLTKTSRCHMVAVGYGVPKLMNVTQLHEIAADNVVMIDKPQNINKYVGKIKRKVCAVDGGYSQWSMWSLCSSTCGVGVRVRGRVCNSPPPRIGGQDCTRLGASYQSQECNDRECPTEPPKCKNSSLDVCIIMDTSLSVRVENLVRVKSFLVQFVHQFDPTTHFSVITFAGKPVVQCKFADVHCQGPDGVHDVISQIPDKLSFGTHTDKALIAADQIVFTPQGGDRAEADNVLIVVTDGKTNKNSAPFNDTVPPLRDNKGVQLIAFGVGPSIHEEDLNEMVGEKNWFYVEHFEEMGERLSNITKVACPQ